VREVKGSADQKERMSWNWYSEKGRKDSKLREWGKIK
jgi:hypothetical protein